MKIRKILIQNYKLFKNATIPVNDVCNIFVGNNDSGKSTLLEVIQILISGKLNNYPLDRQIKATLFNYEVREEFREALRDDGPEIEELPSIVLEAYFSEDDDAQYQGTNNQLRENCPGIHMSLEFDPAYSEVYKSLLKNGEIYDIPIEFYKANWLDFGGKPIISRSLPVKITVIDSTHKNYSSSLNRFISTSVADHLTEREKVDLTLAYRRMKSEFNANESVVRLNERILSDRVTLDNRKVTFSVRERDLDAWETEISIDVDDIPFENMGFGTQNMIKMELAFKENLEKCNIILFEEPENHLSFSNMSRLVARISKDESKQVFIATHSSFVANKLGLNNIFLLNKGHISQLANVSKDTMNFFKKLPGYDTLRFLLSNSVILVEGPSDELIVQRAYRDKNGRLPIEDGVDVISVNALAFARYCNLAILVEKPLRIVTDNDGDIEKNICDRYSVYLEHTDLIKVFYEKDEKLRTLECSVLEKNSDSGDKLEKFGKAISKKDSMMNKSREELLAFMLDNKTEWGLRVFDSEESIEYPEYIERAIEK